MEKHTAGQCVRKCISTIVHYHVTITESHSKESTWQIFRVETPRSMFVNDMEFWCVVGMIIMTQKMFEVCVCVLEANDCFDLISVCYAVDSMAVEDPQTTASCRPDAKQSGHSR